MIFRRRLRYNRRSRIPPQLFIIIVPLVLILFLFSLFRSSPEAIAQETVTSFYTYEQSGDFSGSWDLFHSQMQERFPKSQYIEQRNLVFVSSFGVNTFDYTVGKAESMKTWKMTKDSVSLKNVYKVPITQTYKSTFGTFTLQQDVFVAKEKDEWRLLWSYQ